MNTALLDVRQMGEADRLTVVAGLSGIMMMENAGASVARESIALGALPDRRALRPRQQ